MTVVEGPKSAGLIARIQNILLRPVAEWDVIDHEAATVQGLFTGYACLLAAVGPVALVVQHLLFLRWSIVPIIAIAVLSYVTSLIVLFLIGVMPDALAPHF